MSADKEQPMELDRKTVERYKRAYDVWLKAFEEDPPSMGCGCRHCLFMRKAEAYIEGQIQSLN